MADICLLPIGLLPIAYCLSPIAYIAYCHPEDMERHYAARLAATGAEAAAAQADACARRAGD